MRCLLLFCFMLGLTLAFPTIKLQEPKKDQKIMDLTLETGYMEIYGNNYTKHSQVKARQEKSQPQHAEKVQMDNRRVSPTNDVTDVQAKTNETVFNKTKGIATEMLSFSLKSLKYFHKRSAELSHDQSKLNDSTVFSYPDDSSDPGDTNENSASASLNDSNNTGSSAFSNGAESSESSNPTESNKSDSEEFTYSHDSQETTHAASDELNRSSFLNGITVQSESSEPDTQYSIFTTPDDASENSNEVRDSSIKGEAELSSESQSASSSSESNDQSDSSKASSSSDSNSSSNSSEPMTVSTTEKMI